MHSRQVKFLISLGCLLMAGLASAQTQDNSQNALLKGTYHFRHIAVENVDSNYNPNDITATYGSIVFDGAGNYTLTGTTQDNVLTSGVSQTLSVTGTYAIGSNGAGYITNPICDTGSVYAADCPSINDVNTFIYGAVAQGVFTGSSTESQNDGDTLNDIFIAIPAGANPTNASFTAAYQTGLLDFPGATSTSIKNALFELTPNGQGAFGTISLTGQAANATASTVTQTVNGATYNFNSDGSATLTVPTSANALFAGTKTIFVSADGNFILGWTAGGYDIFFGVKALAVTGTNLLTQGLYFTAALEDNQASGLGTDSYYGGTNNTGDKYGDGIVHQRLNVAGEPSYDFDADDQIVVNASGTTGNSANPVDFNGYEYLFGDGGNAFVAIGANGLYSLQVGLHAPPFSGSGVYLNPIGVTNAASFAPVTASIAPGELLQLTGTGLAAPGTSIVTQGGSAFPTTLGNVTVAIDGTACPIYYVTPTQLAVIVPYEVALNQTGLANIQVTNNNVKSNVVQVYLTDGEPGSFSQPDKLGNVSGIGYAAARHAATGQLITPSNPVVPGEYISLYLTGLGTVTPTITDGAVGPSTTLSYADLYNSGNLTVYFDDFNNGSTGNAGVINFAGLVPTLAGLYQINVQVPTGTTMTAGDDVYVEFFTDASDVLEIQIPYGAGATIPNDARTHAAMRVEAMRLRAARMRGTSVVTRRARAVPVSGAAF